MEHKLRIPLMGLLVDRAQLRKTLCSRGQMYQQKPAETKSKERTEKKPEESIQGLWDNSKRYNICVMGVPGEETEKEQKKCLKQYRLRSTAVKSPSMILYWWVHVIIHPSKPRECTTPRPNPNDDYGLWVITTCQCRLLLGKKMYQSGGDVNSKREYTPCVGERDIWEITVPSQSCKPNYFKKNFF